MLSATLQDGLSEYAIGGKIRALRLEEEDGAGRAGPAHRPVAGAAVEDRAGRLFPTLPTLLRIALVFSVGLDFFFAGARDKPLVAVVRESRARPRCPSGRGARRARTGSSRSTTRRPSGGSTAYYAEFFPVAD